MIRRLLLLCWPSRLAAEPDPGPEEEVPDWPAEAARWKQVALMCLARTFEGRMTFTPAEIGVHGDLLAWEIREIRHVNGNLELRAQPRRTYGGSRG